MTETGYGTAAGLSGINCRHSFYPFFEGISQRAYREAELEEYADKTVTYNGEEMSFYAATQKQREIERKIRYWKRQEGALKAAGLDTAEETAKVRAWQAEMRKFIKDTGLVRQGERERISYTSDLTKSAVKIDFHSKEYQRIADLGEVRKFYQPTDPGFNYVAQRPVMYNGYGASHLTDAEHKIRLAWLEKNQDHIIRAIESPDFLEKSLRLRNDGHYSSTQIVELPNDPDGTRRFMSVAISMSKDVGGKGYHQITTIYPIKHRDLFAASGELKAKYVRTSSSSVITSFSEVKSPNIPVPVPKQTFMQEIITETYSKLPDDPRLKELHKRAIEKANLIEKTREENVVRDAYKYAESEDLQTQEQTLMSLMDRTKEARYKSQHGVAGVWGEGDEEVYQKRLTKLKEIQTEMKLRREWYESMRQLEAIKQSMETGKIVLEEGDVRDLLSKVGDVYIDNGWNPRRGKPPYMPELFRISDLTGAKIRYYITLPDGRIAHPDEILEARSRGRLIVIDKIKVLARDWTKRYR